MRRFPIALPTFIAATAFAIGLLFAALTMPGGALAATPSPAPGCTVKTWQGSPYAFCGSHVCAKVSNVTNRIEWMTRNRTGSTTYRDLDTIRPARPLPLFARHAITSAFVAMQHGPAAPKEVAVCVG